MLCLADSDVRVERDYLRAVVGAQQPEVGIVTSVYRGIASPGFWPGVAVAMTNYHFLPGVITGFLGAHGHAGQTIAITRATLERIGGLTFAHQQPRIMRWARRCGRWARRSSFRRSSSGMRASRRRSRLYAHELRWSCTIRAADRLGHAGSC